MRLTDYDPKEHKCKLCKTLMNKDYFIKYHTPGECLTDNFHREERLKKCGITKGEQNALLKM